jgi:exosortase
MTPALRLTAFATLLTIATAWSWQELTTVIGRSLRTGDYEHYSHIVLLPIVAASLIYLNRPSILRAPRLAPFSGASVTLVGVAIVWLARTSGLFAASDLGLSLAMLGLVIAWGGTFLCCYGTGALRAAAFPFLLLAFMIPLPPTALAAVVVFLQKASAHVAAMLFTLIGMPFFRDDVVFALPGITIEVAEECSGIRSSLALAITGIVMAYLMLRTWWTSAAFALAIIPLAIFKNAVRIVGLSWLAVHVDPGFITGSALHRNSGIPVFLVSLAMLAGTIWGLRWVEGWKR